MKLNFKQLRKLIKEVALSPSLPNNNQIVNNPIDNDLLEQAVSSIQRQFTKMLEKNLVLSSWKSSYNSETREFDDKTYEFIKEVSEKLGEEVATGIVLMLKNVFLLKKLGNLSVKYVISSLGLNEVNLMNFVLGRVQCKEKDLVIQRFNKRLEITCLKHTVLII